MGGADFSSGDGGGSDSGSSSSSDSGSSYDGGSSSGGSSSSSGGDGFVLAFLIGLGVLFLVLAPFAKSKPAGAGTLYLSSIVLGIDWHARRALQAKLAELAAQNLGGTAAGRAKMLQEVVLALQRAELSWLYVACAATPGLSAAAAESRLPSLWRRSRQERLRACPIASGATGTAEPQDVEEIRAVPASGLARAAFAAREALVHGASRSSRARGARALHEPLDLVREPLAHGPKRSRIARGARPCARGARAGGEALAHGPKSSYGPGFPRSTYPSSTSASETIGWSGSGSLSFARSSRWARTQIRPGRRAYSCSFSGLSSSTAKWPV